MPTDRAVTTPNEFDAPRMRAIWPLLILSITVASAVAAQTLFSPLQEAAKAELSLSDRQLSLVQGLAVAVPIALLSLPIGWLIDRGNRIRLTIFMAGLWSIGTIAAAFADSFTTLFAARMVACVGIAGALTAAISIAADLCAPEIRGRSILVLSLGKYLGMGMAFAVGGLMMASFTANGGTGLVGNLLPWREVHLIFGIVIAVLILPLFLIREPARREVESAVSLPLSDTLKALWARRAVLTPLYIGQIAVTMADNAAIIWSTPVLTRFYGLEPQQFGLWMFAAIMLSGIAGSIFGGFIADWGQKKGSGWILFGAVLASGVSIPTALFPLAPSPEGYFIALTLLLLAGAVTGLVTAIALAVLIPNEIRGSAIGLFLIVGAIGGFAIAPTLVVEISRFMGGEAHLATALAWTGFAVSALSFIAFAQAMRRATL